MNDQEKAAVIAAKLFELLVPPFFRTIATPHLREFQARLQREPELAKRVMEEVRRLA